MIFHLLPARRTRAEQGAAGEDKILSRLVHLFIDEEVLLLGTDGRGDLLALDAEQP